MKIFQKDMQISFIKTFHIKNRSSEEIKKIKDLILKKIQSKLFKFWARDKGYDLLIVFCNKKERSSHLKGLVID